MVDNEGSATPATRVNDPANYRDKAGDWYAHFDQMRAEEIEGLIEDEIISEHEANPTGYRQPHSARLQRVLNYFRTQPVLGKYYIYTVEPWKDYRIATIVARGEPPSIEDDPYPTEEAAMHGVFLRRISDLRERVTTITQGEQEA